MLQHKRIYGRLVLGALILCLIPVYASARVRRHTSAAHRTSRTRQSSAASHHYLHRVYLHRYRRSYTRLAKSRYNRHSTRSRTSSRLEIPPERATQIQQALIQAGDLQGQPSGRWDAETRDAMKHYQQSNGFSPTGLPDAKSLMKMGLGPHPLPRDVDPLAQARPIPSQKMNNDNSDLMQ